MENYINILNINRWYSALLQNNGLQKALELSLSSLKLSKRDKKLIYLNITKECNLKTNSSRIHDQREIDGVLVTQPFFKEFRSNITGVEPASYWNFVLIMKHTKSKGIGVDSMPSNTPLTHCLADKLLYIGRWGGRRVNPEDLPHLVYPLQQRSNIKLWRLFPNGSVGLLVNLLCLQ